MTTAAEHESQLVHDQGDGSRSAEASEYRWVEVTASAAYAARDGAGALVFDGRMWILGGGVYDTPDHPTRPFYHDVWSSGDGINWEQHLESAPWESRQYHEVAVFDDALWMVAGNNMEKDVWKLVRT